MSSFVHPALLVGLAMAAAPVLIHLINMLRHRRVPWAAMEFLLASQKKHRTWILLKQLLLLLLRVAAIVLVVLMLAKPRLESHLSQWLGGTRTHHIVLLDDSYSMSDRWADTSAWDEAKSVAQKIGDEAARQVLPQQYTLLRFSRAARLSKAVQPDLLQEQVDTEFGKRLGDALAKLGPSQSSAGPAEALEAAARLLEPATNEQRIVYLLSDFRARQWDDPATIRRAMLRLKQSQSMVMLVNCVEQAHQNLGIDSITPTDGTRAAGVPFFMEVVVHNHGALPANNVSVLLEEDGHPRPAARIERIAPGQAAREKFLISFAAPGDHVLSARLESDSVAADNYRHATLNIPAAVPALLIDGSPDARDARFVAAALAPGGSVRTGISPRTESPRFLSLQPLDNFQSIYLLNVERLERSAMAALDSYVKEGGGLAFFLGERTNIRFYNDELYHEGQGLFPAPLAGPGQLLVDRLQTAPDLEVTDHPIFKIFSGQRNSFISTVLVEQYLATTKNWRPAADSPVRVIAQLRNGAPLAIEQRYGQGRVVAVLTTAAPVWNNWARGNPSFVVAMQELQAYLAQRPTTGGSLLVGAPIQLELSPAVYRPQVRLVPPQQTALPSPVVQAVPGANGSLRATLADTDLAGVYEVHLARTDGTPEVRRYAVNVDPVEGDLRTINSQLLATRLEGLDYEYVLAAAFRSTGRDLAGGDLSQILLYLLVFLLLGEQLLALSASYHPTARHRLVHRGAAS